MACQCFVDIMDYLRLNLPGALDGVLEMEISNTLDEFLSKTNAWVERLPVRVRPGKYDYIIKPASGLMVRLLGVGGADPDIWVPAAMHGLDTLSFRDDPGVTETWTAHVVVKQSPNAGLESIPEWIYENHRLAVQHGVIGRMMTQNAKPYSNERLAIYHMRKFLALTAQVRAERAQQYLYRGQVWNYPQNFARGTQR